MAEALRKLLKDERQLSQITTASFMETDISKSGFVDEKELQKVMTKASIALNCSKPSAFQIKELLKKIEQKKEGKVSFDEFQLLIKIMIKKYLRDLEDGTDNSTAHPQKKSNEDIERQVNKQLHLFQKYLEESGISIAFQIIYTEILSKKIDADSVFTYTAMRLRQIGKEVAHLLPANLAASLSEN